MLIKELSMLTGASIRSLRYYEEKHLIEPIRLENGYRSYNENVVERVKTIQFYLGLGLTTEDIAEIIDCPVSLNPKQPMCKAAYDLYKTKLSTVNKQIDLLQNIRMRLEERIRFFE